ncbi:RNA recognition motif domain-containing protein [Vibrio mediterranei]|uniref:RNA recognition motif domain-containing protein n=1 Tax=Vibrio mediterranei TaxID=689 RepID=UPI00148C6AC5|nr:RNA-binding protein [Vibrio mediterranei]NOI22653.1 RNA-binding protein [Vibrio mediterranei]
MDSNKSLFLVVAIAILGGIVFSQFADVPPAVAFVIGVVATFFVVKFSTASPAPSAETTKSTKTLYVGNLPYKANESHVKELFAEHGEVFAVRLMKDKRTGKRRGFGFVVMASSDAKVAIKALNEKDYMQRTLKVRIANDPKHPESATTEQE